MALFKRAVTLHQAVSAMQPDPAPQAIIGAFPDDAGMIEPGCRFVRVDGGRARADGGAGLGLAIVKHLVQAQGGEVGVESGRGGSRFWIKLPAAP